MTRLIALAALACLATGPASAEAFISGPKLAHACASHAGADANACDGYIAGALDEIASEPSLKGSVCPPANTKLSVLREALAKYGEKNNAESGIALLRDMLKANYPCGGK